MGSKLYRFLIQILANHGFLKPNQGDGLFAGDQGLGFRVPRSRVLESMWIQSCIDFLFKFLRIMVFGAKSREGPF